MKKLSKIYKEILEGIEYKNVSDSDEYWDRVKVIATDNKGDEVGYAILDMYIDESEWSSMEDGDEGKLSDEEFDKHFPDGSGVKLEHLEVHYKYRQSGYGKQLMDAVVKYVKSRGYNTIYLIASPIGFEPKIDLESLSNFYKKYGFKIIKDFGNAHDMVAQLESVKEELTYRHANTKGVEDDEYEIGMVKEGFDEKIMFRQNIEFMLEIEDEGIVRDYYLWLLNTANEVNVTPLSNSNININQLEISESECFNNAVINATQIKGAKFVFGFAVSRSGEVVSHGWIRIGDNYHDATYEKYHTIDNVTYLRLGELDPNVAKNLKIFKEGCQANFADDKAFFDDFRDGKFTSQNESTDLGIHNADYNDNYNGYSY